MFDPSKLISPTTALLESLRRRDDIKYRDLITEYNVEVVKTQRAEGEYNTFAFINNLDDDGNVIKTGRVITYNKIDLNGVITKNAVPVTNVVGAREYHLYDYNATKTITAPTLEEVVDTLRTQYSLDIHVEDLATNVIPEPVREVNYNDRLVNSTAYSGLHTYSGGYVAVNHRDILPTNPKEIPAKMELGLQVHRQIPRDESIELVLPVIKDFDSWTLMVETVEEAVYTKPGVPWFKLVCSAGSNVWVLHIPTGESLEFDSTVENTITITTSGSNISIRGSSPTGDEASTIYRNEIVFPTYGMQCITAYTHNPVPQLLQFRFGNELNTDEPSVTPMSVMNSTDPKRLVANYKSNAVFGETDLPVIITDVSSVNYAEEKYSRFVDKSIVPKFLTGSVTKRIQTTKVSTVLTTFTPKDLSSLASKGALKSVTIKLVNEKNKDNYATRHYEISEYNERGGSYRLVTTDNGTVTADVTGVSTIPFANIIVDVGSDRAQIRTNDGTSVDAVGVHSNETVNRYHATVSVVFTKPTVLPQISCVKQVYSNEL